VVYDILATLGLYFSEFCPGFHRKKHLKNPPSRQPLSSYLPSVRRFNEFARHLIGCGWQVFEVKTGQNHQLMVFEMREFTINASFNGLKNMGLMGFYGCFFPMEYHGMSPMNSEMADGISLVIHRTHWHIFHSYVSLHDGNCA
jgi:hypothetical protein